MHRHFKSIHNNSKQRTPCDQEGCTYHYYPMGRNMDDREPHHRRAHYIFMRPESEASQKTKTSTDAKDLNYLSIEAVMKAMAEAHREWNQICADGQEKIDKYTEIKERFKSTRKASLIEMLIGSRVKLNTLRSQIDAPVRNSDNRTTTAAVKRAAASMAEPKNLSYYQDHIDMDSRTPAASDAGVGHMYGNREVDAEAKSKRPRIVLRLPPRKD
jgi:hypothetical protein